MPGVKGMTCRHCVEAVRAAVAELPGVTDVEVDLSSGRVEIASDPPPDRETLRAAVTEAGYELVG